MGFNVDDYHGSPHISDGVLFGFQLHLHRGDQDIETWSPEVPKSSWNKLISVAQVGTLADLDAVGASIWPQWWPVNVHARVGGVAAVRLVLLS
jgi:hypothetical protein